MESRIAGKNGCGWGNSVFFETVSNNPITEEMALVEQQKLGYHPAGYGFYSFKCRQEGDKYIANWECAASCD